MEYFCLPPNGKYYCLAPNWPGFNPDVQVNDTDLFLDVVISSLIEISEVKKLKDITWVFHDWGSFIGYWVSYLRPDIVPRMIQLDIGNLCTNCTTNTTY